MYILLFVVNILWQAREYSNLVALERDFSAILSASTYDFKKVKNELAIFSAKADILTVGSDSSGIESAAYLWMFRYNEEVQIAWFTQTDRNVRMMAAFLLTGSYDELSMEKRDVLVWMAQRYREHESMQRIEEFWLIAAMRERLCKWIIRRVEGKVEKRQIAGFKIPLPLPVPR